MWSTFRAMARRIGMSAKQVDAVERGGAATEVQHPLDNDVHVKVRPEPDWSRRLAEAWNGELVDSRREVAGVITLDGAALAVVDADSPGDGLVVPVSPGQYRLVLTVAYLGAEWTPDYEEHVSHAFMTLLGDHKVAAIEPCRDDDGVEVKTNGFYPIAFAIPGTLLRIAGDHAGVWAIRLSAMFNSQTRADGQERHLATIADDDGSVAAFVCYPGHGRASYPLFQLVDEDGQTVGVAADFYVDNRPWD